MIKLKDFFNKLYEDNTEINAIVDAVQPQLDEIDKRSFNIFKDIFPIIATENGIIQWEKVLDIHHNPLTENIDFRRERIILRLSTQQPFTERFMINYFNNVFGEGNWRYILNYNAYSLHLIPLIPYDNNWNNEIDFFVKYILPCNIGLFMIRNPNLYFVGILTTWYKSNIYMEVD